MAGLPLSLTTLLPTPLPVDLIVVPELHSHNIRMAIRTRSHKGTSRLQRHSGSGGISPTGVYLTLFRKLLLAICNGLFSSLQGRFRPQPRIQTYTANSEVEELPSTPPQYVPSPHWLLPDPGEYQASLELVSNSSRRSPITKPNRTSQEWSKTLPLQLNSHHSA